MESVLSFDRVCSAQLRESVEVLALSAYAGTARRLATYLELRKTEPTSRRANVTQFTLKVVLVFERWKFERISPERYVSVMLQQPDIKQYQDREGSRDIHFCQG